MHTTLQESNTKTATSHKNTEIALNSEGISYEPTTGDLSNNNEVSQDIESSQNMEPSSTNEPSQENTTAVQETIPETTPSSLPVENDYFNDKLFLSEIHALKASLCIQTLKCKSLCTQRTYR